MRTRILALSLAAVLALSPTGHAQDLTAAEVRAIAKQAYTYGYPLVDSYRIQYRESFARIDVGGGRTFDSASFSPEILAAIKQGRADAWADLPQSLLVANPIDRYLINSPMLSDLELDADGGLTLLIQNESPGAARESNWLPAPTGPFAMYTRLYWPTQAALDGA